MDALQVGRAVDHTSVPDGLLFVRRQSESLEGALNETGTSFVFIYAGEGADPATGSVARHPGGNAEQQQGAGGRPLDVR